MYNNEVLVLVLIHLQVLALVNPALYPAPPGKCGGFKCLTFKHSLGVDILTIQVSIAFEWIPDDFVDAKSILVQVVARYRQATISWTSSDQDLRRNMTSFNQNENAGWTSTYDTRPKLQHGESRIFF